LKGFERGLNALSVHNGSIMILSCDGDAFTSEALGHE